MDGVVKIICQADPEGLPDKQNKEAKEQWDVCRKAEEKIVKRQFSWYDGIIEK